MNLRQKNKKLKQELEWYKKQMVPTRKIAVDSRQMRVETLCSSSCYHGALDAHCRTIDPEGFITHVKEGICNELATTLEDYIKVDVVYYEDSDIYEYRGKLKVVVPKE